MSHEQQIKRFVRRLAAMPVSHQTFNLYAGKSRSARICRANLECYLLRLASQQPKVMLLGEAPGYKGCRLTGIPFTSEKILRTHPLFADADFEVLVPSQRPETEISSTVVWNTLSELKTLPVLWNIFPFHPFKSGAPQSNRTPTAIELVQGKAIMLKLVSILHIQHIIAIGKKANSQLSDLEIKCSCVRHPANGGATPFRLELKALFH